MLVISSMPRKKQYNEQEVLTKAMKVFWKNGYERTSMQMLVNEMGINKFSIYSSFGSKQGLFLKSIESYNEKTRFMFDKLKASTKGIDGIKDFFYDSIKLAQRKDFYKGCLITNTYNEFAIKKNDVINHQMNQFVSKLKDLFIEKLSQDRNKDKEIILMQANYLLLAKHGLATAAKVNSDQEIKDYIEMTFRNL